MAVQFNGSTQGYFSTLKCTARVISSCMFVRPEQVATDRFKAFLNFGQTPFQPYHFIVWMDDDGSGPSIMASFDDEAPDYSRIPFNPNQWYFVATTEFVAASPTAGWASIYVKQVGGTGFKVASAVPSGGSGTPVSQMSLGVDTFGEFGKSSICGVRVWQKFKTLAEIEVESHSIRAVDRRGLVGEYPLNYPELRDYSGAGSHLTLDGSPFTLGTLTAPTQTNGPNVPQFYRPAALRLENWIPSTGLLDVDAGTDTPSVTDSIARDEQMFRVSPGGRTTRFFID